MSKKTSRTKTTTTTKPAPARRPPAAKPKSTAQDLERLIKQMAVERQHHLDSIAEIDQTFKEFGISTEGGKRSKGGSDGAASSKKSKGGKAGGKPAAKSGGKTGGASKSSKKAKPANRKGVKPGRFEVTGDQLIVDFLRANNGATTEEIRKHWDAAGRRGKAENNLTNLVRSGKISRTKRTDGPGSRYEAL